MKVTQQDGKWILLLNNEVLAIFINRDTARRFLLWKGQKHEKTN
jgi:hypothetical protein